MDAGGVGRRGLWGTVGLVAVVALVVACSPTPAPTPASGTAPPEPSALATPSPTPAASSPSAAPAWDIDPAIEAIDLPAGARLPEGHVVVVDEPLPDLRDSGLLGEPALVGTPWLPIGLSDDGVLAIAGATDNPWGFYQAMARFSPHSGMRLLDLMTGGEVEIDPWPSDIRSGATAIEAFVGMDRVVWVERELSKEGDTVSSLWAAPRDGSEPALELDSFVPAEDVEIFGPWGIKLQPVVAGTMGYWKGWYSASDPESTLRSGLVDGSFPPQSLGPNMSNPRLDRCVDGGELAISYTKRFPRGDAATELRRRVMEGINVKNTPVFTDPVPESYTLLSGSACGATTAVVREDPRRGGRGSRVSWVEVTHEGVTTSFVWPDSAQMRLSEPEVMPEFVTWVGLEGPEERPVRYLYSLEWKELFELGGVAIPVGLLVSESYLTWTEGSAEVFDYVWAPLISPSDVPSTHA